MLKRSPGRIERLQQGILSNNLISFLTSFFTLDLTSFDCRIVKNIGNVSKMSQINHTS